MRLSEAILAGSTLIKWNSGGEKNADGSGCAIGMGLEAVGKRVTKEPYLRSCDASEQWPWLSNYAKSKCTCDSHLLTAIPTFQNVIRHLFDIHVMGSRKDWTLEQLCDYVRSVEPAEAPGCAEPAAPCTDAVSMGVA